MFNFNTILRELREVPSDRMDDLYHFIHSLNPKNKKSDSQRKKIMAFAGIFSDMSEADYADFKRETSQTRMLLFDRKFE